MRYDVSRLESILKENAEELSRLKVKSLFIFGSTARGDNKTDSDLDFLVEFSNPVGMFDFLELRYFLEKIFNSKIDLATKRALHPRLRDSILNEVIRVA